MGHRVRRQRTEDRGQRTEDGGQQDDAGMGRDGETGIADCGFRIAECGFRIWGGIGHRLKAFRNSKLPYLAADYWLLDFWISASGLQLVGIVFWYKFIKEIIDK
jgi:hypothetical protein